MMQAPTLELERALWAKGYRFVAGVDEAGRGALAGPVVAAAVVIDPVTATHPVWSQVRDSKLLTPAQRQVLAPQIEAVALAWAVGSVPASDIDRCGIAAATRQAMCTAVGALANRPEYLLIDWVKLPALNIHQCSSAKADQRIACVAAASILAKVHRDRRMVELDGRYPAYGFAAHKGYGAPAHLAAIQHCGPCAEHRHSFAPMAQMPDLFAAHLATE
jgi:ribonuclease HII